MTEKGPKEEVKEEVKGETTEDDILDIDTNDIVLSDSGLKDYRNARPARGARVSKSTVRASKSVREPA
jgi:hypothetical protein